MGVKAALLPAGITFDTPVERMPPQRELMDAEGDFTCRLTKLSMELVRAKFRGMFAVRSTQGRPGMFLREEPGLLQYWVDSLWEALFNPILVYVDPTLGDRSYVMKGGVHRTLTLDALGASHVWAYVYRRPEPHIPHPYLIENAITPRRGGRVGLCPRCGAVVGLRKRRFTCGSCGLEEEMVAYPRSMSEVE